MNTWLLFLLPVILSVTWVSVTISEAVIVQTVNVGHLAELPCPSSDDDHRFMFWQLSDGKNIVGPGNAIDRKKYNYEVLTGRLMIRGVSTAESGFYKCISRGIADNSAINVQAVELIVRRDWEDAWENDFETNLLRSLAAVMVIVVTIAVLLYIITSKRRKEEKYFEMDDSRENSPERYKGESKRPVEEVRTSSSPIEEIGIDNSLVDVDFPKVFTQMHQEQAVGIP